ncbi:hypothetical protein CDL12_26618 [Handroanthus impetiginosus]|uniref:Uncharacterized protein n=1 Tax=Handroanthus impetiginosus TaxID=429701 RepID=A0A2G9G6Q4_9LAMI|nr:hypothetical protein CDL12_26618 [Handroanthus impetiginosus]
MNGRQPRRISNCFKDKEEELSFFRDLQKREKDQVGSLLQPVSEEFEPCGTYGMYKMESGGKRGTEAGFLAESGKKDYNWLKTPPATPLFPSLEMETAGQELIIQREIPIIQPLTRFAGNQESTKTKTVTNTSTTTPNPNPKPVQRHKTPSRRPTIPSSIYKKNMKIAPATINQKTSGLPDETKVTLAPVVKSTIKKENTNNASSNREVSTLARPNIPGFPEETPPNLRTTNRATSATRGRPTNQNQLTPQKQGVNSKIRRQSCSPSVARGRKVETDGNAAKQTTGNRAQVLGSRMVDRFITARISGAEERQAKMRQNGLVLNKNSSAEDRQPKIKMNGSSMNECSGFGRLMPKSSLDMAIKHMEFQRDSSNTRKHGATVPARKS